MKALNNLKFEEELTDLINRRSLESKFADTPDFILAGYIMRALDNYRYTVSERDKLHLFNTHPSAKARE